MKLYRPDTIYAFIVPVVAAAFGLGATATSLLSVAMGLGLSFAAKALMPKPKKTATQSGVRVGLQIETDAARSVIFGHAATGGQLVYWHTFGASNKYLQLVIAIASHPIDGVSEIRINGSAVTYNPATGGVAEFPGMTIAIYDGTQTTADSSIVSNSGGRWASTAVGRGVAYAAVTMSYDQAKYPKGIPEFLFRVRGAKLLDPRTGTVAYTDNPAVITYNLIRGVSHNGVHLIGLRSPVDSIRSSDAIAAANACDELVNLKAGGSEKRYRCGFVIDCSSTNRDSIELSLSAMGGKLIHAGGIYRIMAGVASTAVATLTDDDLISDEPMVTSAKHPRSEMVNAVFGSFADPAINFKMRPLPGRTSAADEAADGGIRLPVTVEMPAVFSATQGQRLMEIERRRARRMTTVKHVVRARWSVLEAGDWITFTSNRRGYSAKTFELIHTERRQNQQIELTLHEMDASFDDWVAFSDELDDDTVSDLPPGMPPVAVITPTALANITFDAGGGVSRPGLSVSWVPPGDPTITELVLDFRKVGDSVAMERRIASPEAGTSAWPDGVQGGVQYECRLIPVTIPRRDAIWSAWVATAAASAPQVVGASLTNEVAPDTITLDMLDPEARWNAQFALRVSGDEGSLSAAIARLKDDLQKLGASVLTHRIDLADTTATVRTEQMERVSLNEAFAAYKVEVSAALADIGSAAAIQTLQAQVNTIDGQVQANASAITTVGTQTNGNTSSISQILSDSNGNKRFALVMDTNGKVTYPISLDGTTQGTTLALGIDQLHVYDPSVNGGVPIPLLDVATVGGQAEVFINGALIAKSIEAGVISALSGTIGKLTDPNGAFFLDMTNGNLARTDGGMTINLKTPKIEMVF